jgi:hypothetical protein
MPNEKLRLGNPLEKEKAASECLLMALTAVAAVM